ncbi:hypothetical protein E8Z51_003225 [Escherichia coli]|nr:hypothetical protein [Escherichia coli]EEZ9985766.1 hypothetical protein [Escherichia coli]
MSTGLRFTLEVDGLPPDAFAVVSFHLNQSLSCNQVNHLIPTRVLVKGGEITCKILK